MKNENLFNQKKKIIETTGWYQAIAYVVKILNNLIGCILK